MVMNCLINKKGDANLLNVILFLVLNLVFISVMFVFLDYVGSRAGIYEQTYAKQIALIIDNARPEMVVVLDVSDGLKVGKKSVGDLSRAFVLEDGRVKVDLGGGGGYSYEYFSNYDVKFTLVGDEVTIGIVRMGEEFLNHFKKGLTQNNIQQEGTSYPSLDEDVEEVVENV